MIVSIFSHIYANRHSAEYSTHCRHSWLFSVQLFSLCYSALRVSLDSQLYTLNSGNLLSSNSVPFPASWPRTTIEAVIWDNHKVSLTCLPSLRDHCRLLPYSQCFEDRFIYFVYFFFFGVVSDGRINLLYHLNCKERSVTKFTVENCLRVK